MTKVIFQHGRRFGWRSRRTIKQTIVSVYAQMKHFQPHKSTVSRPSHLFWYLNLAGLAHYTNEKGVDTFQHSFLMFGKSCHPSQ